MSYSVASFASELHPLFPMEILVNGEPRRFEGSLTVADLLESMGLAQRRVAVEVNREIVPRSQHGRHPLKQSDRVEVVFAIGGG
ncbi:sulfur carrier protein ThiS [Sulfurifustis variabilis]|nr:sulfur carrier protein ThiS [Sulfurifustis variabilis]